MTGDENWPGFEDFFREYRKEYLRVARRRADPHTAEDAVQAALVQMLNRWETLTAREGSLAAYGRQAVRNATVDQYRKNKNTIPMPVTEMPERDSDIGIPEAVYESVRSEIYNLVAELPERQRQVVNICILQGHSHAEAAHRLGLKEASVKTYLKSARKNLKKKASLQPSEEVTA